MAALSAILVAVSVAYVGPSHADDTYIYMRYVGNLLGGNGLSFNPGEQSQGMTSVAWALMMITPAALFGNTLAVWKAASWFCYGLLCWAVSHAILSRARQLLPACLIVVAILVEPHLLRWSGSGMENALAGLAIVALIVAWRAVLRDGASGAAMGPLLALAPLARPELALLAGLIVLEWASLARSRGQWAGLVRAIAVAAVLVTLTSGAMFAMTGYWLPQSAAAKAIASVQLAPTYALERTSEILVTGAGVFVLAGLWLLRSPQARPMVRPGLLFMALVWFYLAWQNHLVTTRYSVSLNFPLMVCVGLAVIDLGRARLAVVLPAFAVQTAVAIGVLAYTFPGTRTAEGEDIRRFAGQIRALTEPGARIALSEIGAFGFFADRYIIDTIGLVDPATVDWLKVHGPPRNDEQMEQLLEHRHATHFIDTSTASIASGWVEGKKFKFVPLADGIVYRNNAVGWGGGLWRFYRLDPLPGTAVAGTE